jgi:hypothetical protein
LEIEGRLSRLVFHFQIFKSAHFQISSAIYSPKPTTYWTNTTIHPFVLDMGGVLLFLCRAIGTEVFSKFSHKQLVLVNSLVFLPGIFFYWDIGD